MEEDFFRIGFTTYLNKKNINKTKRTSSFIKMIAKHRFIFTTILIVILSLCMNFWLIFKFMSILQKI